VDYQATLSHLLGLIGQPVRVEISAAVTSSIRATAGFIGVLQRGVSDPVITTLSDDEAINFRVVPEGITDDRASWFVIPRDRFEGAVLVDGPLGQTLTIRADGSDISIKLAPEAR
jgi:hypothetical protein